MNEFGKPQKHVLRQFGLRTIHYANYRKAVAGSITLSSRQKISQKE